MFGKSDQERISDTLALIRQARDLTDGVRQQICGWLARMSPAEPPAYHDLSQSMSVRANIAPGVAKGDEQQRRMRRAIVLLWKAIGKAQNATFDTDPRAAAAMTRTRAELDAALSDVMLRAAVVASPDGAQAVMRQLELQPEQFLKRHRLMISGSTKGSDRFSTAPVGNYQNVLRFNFQYFAGKDRFVMAPDARAGYGAAHLFSTVSVPAVHWAQIRDVGAKPPYSLGGIRGCELAGAGFMLTTQFTGCAFSWTDDGEVLRASHVSPGGGTLPRDHKGPTDYPGGQVGLARDLMAKGAMANAPGAALTVFGSGAGNARVQSGSPFYTVPEKGWASIIGVLNGGAWHFYDQVVDGAGIIHEARQIL